MDQIFRMFMNRNEIEPPRHLYVKSHNDYFDRERELWHSLIGFFDIDEVEFVYLEPKTVISIDGRRYTIKLGTPYVPEGLEMRALKDRGGIYYDDDVIISGKKVLRLRDFRGKTIKVLKKAKN